ncbi:uncharacterized protein LOC132699063 [Cylas formicarius]|uniref:uncharacterized protein LOC132699063 n=1 Tax=Cylas formicarius TaxID=197179 RepID=UPI0029588F24|nr:uncharacterized protein LOC132699063 [Cylas formicarius]
MYAAAGGASLASRQARQKQRLQKTKQLKQQKVAELSSKPPQAKQFHNYTDDPASVPKLSKVERGTLRPPAQHERRHSTSNYLKEPHARARLRESPSISIPIQLPQPLLRENHVSTPSLQSQLPQIFIPPDGESKLERRCSFVRQVEEMGRQEQDVLDRCNHICNFEIKDKTWEEQERFYRDYEKDVFGSLDYPFSECSQGRAAWQERERGRRCSLSEEARQHRIKQTEAHHRWMKRNRIHDTSYGGGSDDEDLFSVYHQSAAANALLYVGLGTTAIGSVIFFVGTGEKGFKTLELRLIGPTLIACGLLCCLIRVLLCACPSTCFRRHRKKTRLKSNAYPRSSTPKLRDAPDPDFVPVDKTSLLSDHCRNKKKVSIVPPNHSLPSTSTTEFKELPSSSSVENDKPLKLSIPQINLPELADSDEQSRTSREDSIIELPTIDSAYDIQSVSSNESETDQEAKTRGNKLTRTREPKSETSLSVVIERREGGGDKSDSNKKDNGDNNKHHHSGIVLSPLQLGQ